jgi:hypothetical protein
MGISLQSLHYFSHIIVFSIDLMNIVLPTTDGQNILLLNAISWKRITFHEVITNYTVMFEHMSIEQYGNQRMKTW